jgi:hypothetical protein
VSLQIKKLGVIENTCRKQMAGGAQEKRKKDGETQQTIQKK